MATRRAIGGRQKLSGIEKAAILLITLGPETSANVFKYLDEEEIEELTLEIANTRKVDNSVKEHVLEDFYQMALAQDYISQGGINYAKEVLERALGTEKAVDIINRLTSTLQVRPFDFARKTDPAQLLSYLQGEHPQTIALVLAFLHPDQAAMILASLSTDLQYEVTKRIAIMDRTSPEVIREVERVLEHKLSSVAAQDYTTVGGVDTVVEIITRVDRGTEKAILESLEVEDPELAEDIRKKMFVFEDIVLLDDRSIQQVVREIDNNDWALALKAASDEVKERVFSNMSSRMSQMIKEDMEYMGPVRLSDIEAAQQRIVGVIRKLEESGEIIVVRGGGDEIIV